AAAVPDGRAGSPASPAVPRSVAEVLPARCLRLGVLPLWARTAVRLRQLRRPAAIFNAQKTSGKSDVLLYVGLALVLVGLLFKASAAPFHSWTPDVYQGSATPVAAF